jgi:hypothetical protein
MSADQTDPTGETEPTEPPQPAAPSEPPPPPPAEVEQAALLGHIDDAVNLYVKFTGVDRDTAREVVERFAE